MSTSRKSRSLLPLSPELKSGTFRTGSTTKATEVLGLLQGKEQERSLRQLTCRRVPVIEKAFHLAGPKEPEATLTEVPEEEKKAAAAQASFE